MRSFVDPLLPIAMYQDTERAVCVRNFAAVLRSFESCFVKLFVAAGAL